MAVFFVLSSGLNDLYGDYQPSPPLSLERIFLIFVSVKGSKNALLCLTNNILHFYNNNLTFNYLNIISEWLLVNEI